ncbi:MAG TPA: hypothetical protein VGU69_03450 [Rhizomicrobium sp.]|nr:hypothetical protein [Rhizomicrobium sp.]
MGSVKTEKRHGYDIHVRAVLVHHGLDVGHRHEGSAGQPDEGYLPLVQIVRDGEVCADWHVPRECDRRCSREEAQERGLAYALRLVGPQSSSNMSGAHAGVV